jgi:hypothetical protein
MGFNHSIGASIGNIDYHEPYSFEASSIVFGLQLVVAVGCQVFSAGIKPDSGRY